MKEGALGALWLHECMRLFSDRLVTARERAACAAHVWVCALSGLLSRTRLTGGILCEENLRGFRRQRH